MIRVLLAPEADLRRQAAELALARPNVFWLSTRPSLERSWCGVRQLVQQAAVELGEAATRKVLAGHAEVAGLLFDRFTTEAPSNSHLAVAIESHLTHNWAVQRPLMRAVASMLGDLLVETRSPLVIPCLNRLDWESYAAIKALYRLPVRCWPELIVGFDGHLDDPKRDADGIEWRMKTRHMEAGAMCFAAMPGARVEARSGLGSDDKVVELDRKAETLEPWIEGTESEAARFLAETDPVELLDGRASEPIVETIEWCFARCGFTAALRLGRALCARGLTGELAARAHGVVALSAHNRQFRSEDNRALARFIVAHLESALAAENRPHARCALHYRLAVAYGRRLGDFEPADRFSARGAREADRLETDDRPRYQGVWARNIRAYVHARRGEPERAMACMKEAAAEVRGAAWKSIETATTEISRLSDLRLTRSLVLHNLSTSQTMSHFKGSAATLEEACRFEDAIEGSAKYWGQSLIESHRSAHRPDLALVAARQALRAATRDRDALRELFFLTEVADLAYRSGAARSAARFFRAAAVLTARIRPLKVLSSLVLPTALALERAGELKAARQLLESFLADSEELSLELRAEVGGRLAVVMARLGNREASQAWADRAIECAAEDRHRHCLVRTGILLGRAARLRGRSEDAYEALVWAERLTDARERDDSVAPVDRLRLIAEIYRSNPSAEISLARLDRLVPDALAAPSAWWTIGPILEMWLERQGRLTSTDAGLEAIELLAAAGVARADTRKVAIRVLESIELARGQQTA